MSAERWIQLAVGALTGALGGCLFYAIDRTRAAIAMGAVDPTAIVATVRVEYFWRLGLSAFVASVAAIGGWWLASRLDPSKALQATTRALIPVTLLCAALSVIWP